MYNQNINYNNPNLMVEDNMNNRPMDNYYGRRMTTMPQPMSGNITEDDLYPLESSFSPSQFNPTYEKYAKGGMVESTGNPLPSLAELIRQQGNNEDSILAHINPIEAMVLKSIGGSGTINPTTGLPQFSFWTNPGKAMGSSAGSIIGSIIGNMILPGIGGTIGGAIGQGTQHKMRGKSFMQGAGKGAAIGSAIPSAAGIAGSAAGNMGFNSAANYLNNYANTNAILPSLGFGGSGGAPSSYASSSPTNLSQMITPPNALANGSVSAGNATSNAGFLDKLTAKSTDFFTDPRNLLAVAAAGGSFLNRPKEKTPERLAQEQKRYQRAMQLTPEERAAVEADRLASRQMERRLASNQYLPEERFSFKPMNRRVSDEDEYRRTGRWINYDENPLAFKKGGMIPKIEFESVEFEYPEGEGHYLEGDTGGQADVVDISAANGEYITPADVVASLGDGNSNAGAKVMAKLTEIVRKTKGYSNKLPPKIKEISKKLPSQLKPLATYIRGMHA